MAFPFITNPQRIIRYLLSLITYIACIIFTFVWLLHELTSIQSQYQLQLSSANNGNSNQNVRRLVGSESSYPDQEELKSTATAVDSVPADIPIPATLKMNFVLTDVQQQVQDGYEFYLGWRKGMYLVGIFERDPDLGQYFNIISQDVVVTAGAEPFNPHIGTYNPNAGTASDGSIAGEITFNVVLAKINVDENTSPPEQIWNVKYITNINIPLILASFRLPVGYNPELKFQIQNDWWSREPTIKRPGVDGNVLPMIVNHCECTLGVVES